MIEGGWSYIYPAYAITAGGLAVLAAVVILRLRYWAERARKLEKPKA